jgi:hypothetical protein
MMDIRLYLEMPGGFGKLDPAKSLYQVRAWQSFICS